MEAGRRNARAGLLRAASAAARLANVVRRARVVSTEPVVCSNGDFFVARQAGSRGAVRAQSISTKSAALRSRDGLSLPFHDSGGTPGNRRFVETSGAWRIFAGRFARRRPLRSLRAGVARLPTRLRDPRF